jgi:kumamolisin
VDAFFRSIDQPSPQITDISVDGTKNNHNQHLGAQDDPDFEVALDIQVAGAAYFVATGKPAAIRVYWSQDIASAVQQATADGCDVCSISWGSDEANWGQAAADEMEAAATAATQAGMVVFAASGDNDSGDGGPTPANVDVPSSCPHVIGCGGTSKTPNAETVWNNNPGSTDGEGTGGGFSTLFPVQSFQARAPSGPGRMVPDVAADADPNTGYIIWVHGARVVGEGGTSAVAPLYAGLFASFGIKLGFVTPKLWANQLCFNDITVGDNGFFRAGVGPDPCTGLGSPIGVKLAALFKAAPPSLTNLRVKSDAKSPKSPTPR